MAVKFAKETTCACGTVFHTKGTHSFYCQKCAHERVLARRRAWDKAHNAQKVERARLRRERKRAATSEAATPQARLLKAREVPCMAGCGAMVLSTCTNGRVLCPTCRTRRSQEAMDRYRASEKGKAAKAREQQKALTDEELRARKREWARRYYSKHREEVLAKLWAERAARRKEAPPKPELKPAPKPPKPEPKPKTAKLVAPERKPHLPTEEEKLAMLRAAMKRYYGG